MPFRRSSSDDQLFLFVELAPPEPPKRAPNDPFTDGYECPVPERWPTGGGPPQEAWDRMWLYHTRNWKRLREIKDKWYCENCGHWHYFTERFFQEYKGKVPTDLMSDEGFFRAFGKKR